MAEVPGAVRDAQPGVTAIDRDEWRSPRIWVALLLLITAYFTADGVETALYRPIARAAGLHMIVDGAMAPLPYGALMLYRLAWNIVVVAVLCAVLGRPLNGFPITGPRAGRRLLLGLAIGLCVMIAAILAIVLTGSATVSPAHQAPGTALGYGLSWLVFDFAGATGEELFGRVAILIVVERFLGWRGAILVSGILFAGIHLGNPGASAIWLVRLGVQGMLLAYAVYRTRSVWWSAGYHTGWNWASAPLFGAAGSGYLDQGHLLDFTPTGSVWITGGEVGPEGSIFAFVAVLAAFLLLRLATPEPKTDPGAAAR